MSVNDIGEAVTWGEAIDLVSGLIDEWGSRTHASVMDWKFPMTRELYVLQMHAMRFINLHRGKDTPVFDFDWPFPNESNVSAEERARLTAELERRSAFNR